MCVVCSLSDLPVSEASSAHAAENGVSEAATPVEAVQGSQTWGDGQNTVVTYFLGDDGDATGNQTGEADWSQAEIASVQLAFAEISHFADIEFVQVYDYESSNISLVLNDDAYSYGSGYGPSGLELTGTVHGDIALNHSLFGRWEDGSIQGGAGFETLIHEIGHALGLGHSHDTSMGSQILAGVGDGFSLGDLGLNDPINTVMAYNDGWFAQASSHIDHGNRGTFGAWDIAALQAMYGVNQTFAQGNDEYNFAISNGAGAFYSTIWDTGGVDTLNASQATGAAILDLRAATLDYNPQTSGGAVSYVHDSNGQMVYGGYTIAAGAVIENATGGSGNDRLVGNFANNVLIGGAGNDTFYVNSDSQYSGSSGGHDLIQGGAGYDVVMLDGVVSDYFIVVQGDYLQLFYDQGSVQVSQDVEMIAFSGGLVSVADLRAQSGSLTMIESNGNFHLGAIEQNDSYGIFTESWSEQVTVKYNGEAISVSQINASGWQAVQVAETGFGGFWLLWEIEGEDGSKDLYVWQLDEDGNRLDGYAISVPEYFEPIFSADIDGDMLIGDGMTEAIEAEGSASLFSTSQDTLWIASKELIQVTEAGAAVSLSGLSQLGWTPVQVETDTNGFVLLWQNLDGEMMVWHLDDNGGLLNQSLVDLEAADWLEALFVTDFNEDGRISSPTETNGREVACELPVSLSHNELAEFQSGLEEAASLVESEAVAADDYENSLNTSIDGLIF